MNLHTIVSGEWMISPQMLHTIQDIYRRHISDVKLTQAEITKIIGGKVREEDRDFSVTENGTAIIPIHGVVAKRMNIFHDISGGVSSELVTKQLSQALNSPDVKAVILDIDSPGGTVDGSFELADFIFESREIKPIVAHSDGVMTSAAFLFGAATSKIITSSQLVQVGGIGVVTEHEDISKAEEMQGRKVTVLHSGKFKALGNPHLPLSVADSLLIKDKLDFMYTHFINTVAKFRSVSVDEALNMAEGRVFMGDNAIDAGLIDEISSLDNLISEMPNLSSHRDKDRERVGVFAQSNNDTNNLKGVSSMQIKSIKDLKKNCSEEDLRSIFSELSVASISEFKESSEYLGLQKKAELGSLATSKTDAHANEKLKAELESTKTALAKLDKRFFATQMSANKSISDRIFSELVSKADCSEMVQSKILSNKPDFEKHLSEEGNLIVGAYTEACATEIESWSDIIKGSDQTVGAFTEKDAVSAVSSGTAYPNDDKAF